MFTYQWIFGFTTCTSILAAQFPAVRGPVGVRGLAIYVTYLVYMKTLFWCICDDTHIFIFDE